MHKLLVTYVSLSFMCFIKAQSTSALPSDNCLPQTIFRTDSLGKRTDKLAFALTFKFTADSIRVFAGKEHNNNSEFMAFKIEKKDICGWNSDYTIGKSSYQLILIDKRYTKRARLNIIYESGSKKYIELLYENSEERIFTIAQ